MSSMNWPSRRLRVAVWLAFASSLVCGCSAAESGSSASRRGSGASAGGSALPSAASGSSAARTPGSTLLTPDKRSAAPLSDNETCASAVVQTAKNMPSIVFVIDGSGSMCAPFGQSTRWQALRRALLDPSSGFIYRLQSSVYFGATLYDGTIDANLSISSQSGLAQNPPCALLAGALGGKDMGMCPQLVEALPPKLNNAQAIDMAYPMLELGGSTPTDRALGHVMDALIAGRQQQGPDAQAQSPVYVILATDGAPNDICVNGMGGDGSAQRQGVIAAADRGAAVGITTWVISLADDATLQMHLDEVARHGDPKNPGAHTFSPTNPDELVMTLAQLLGGAVGCHIELNGKVSVGQECLGTVEQNGLALACCEQPQPGTFSCGGMPTSAPNGWRLSDAHSIELVGDACAKFLLGSGSVLSARFPCRVFTPN